VTPRTRSWLGGPTRGRRQAASPCHGIRHGETREVRKGVGRREARGRRGVVRAAEGEARGQSCAAGVGCVAHLAVKTPDTQPTTESTNVGARTGGMERKPGSAASASFPASTTSPASTKQGT